MSVIGSASISNHFTEEAFANVLPELRHRLENKKTLAVKVKIEKTDYFQFPQAGTQNLKQEGIQQFIKKLLNPDFVQKDALTSKPKKIE